ncbi:OmpA family protein [Actinomadura sp. SCN-SB]|uniref:OmpA family protein n=1 Tax=Actinomadura sp. SCN-SB TaxID=3373092 RepID=UPI003753B5F3
MASAAVLAALLAGLPWLLLVATGSPIPDRWPTAEEVVAALIRPADGTLLLATLKYLSWLGWALWAVLVMLEAAARLSGQVAPTIPGLSAPQNLAAVAVGGLLAAVLGAAMSLNRATAAPTASLVDVIATAPPPAAPDEHRAAATQQATLVPPPPDRTPIGTFTPGRGDAPSGEGEASPGEDASPDAPRATVRFAFDSAELTPSARSTLDHLADDIAGRAAGHRPVVIVGHTDSHGSADYNRRLSLRRADTVREALIGKLGTGYRFRVAGEGEAAPIAAETRPDGGDDPTGRARNRRVEITYTLRASAPAPAPRPTAPTSPHPGTTTTPAPSPSASSAPESGAGAPPARQAPETGRSSTAPASPSPSESSSSEEGWRESGPVSVRLPSGALAGLGLAAAISVAVAAARLHRRHRRALAPDRLGVTDPEPAQGAAVRVLRKAHVRSAAAMGEPVRSDQQLVEDDRATGMADGLVVGERDGRPVTVPLPGLNVGLTGPGAAAAARAIATELLARAHGDRIELLTPAPTAATVFGLTDDQVNRLGDTLGGLTVAADLAAAVEYLETEVLHRARMMSEHEVGDVAALRAADPDEPLPALVLIAHPDERQRLTVEALQHRAEDYGLGAVLLGACPTGTTCHVDGGGHVLKADGPDAARWAGARLFHLTPQDTAELLQTIRAARGEDPATSADASAAVPGSAPSRPSGPAPTTEPPAEPPEPPAKSSPGPSVASSKAPDPDRMGAPLRPPRFGRDRGCPVRVRLFGPVRVDTDQGPVSTGLRQVSRDLLVLLALHPEGITREQGIDAIWPDRDLDGGSTMFHTAVNNARKRLRTATGLREPMFINHAGGRYRLDAHLIDVDLWHFLHAIEAAATADDDPGRISALRRIAEVYTGELAEDLTYEWAERERERIRRTATDALVRLAHLLRDDDPEDALRVLEQAFEHDPFSEPLACEVMQLQAAVGNADGVRRTYRLLAHRLNEIDIDPSPDTERLQSALLRQHNLAQRKAAAQAEHLAPPQGRSRPRSPRPPGS